MAENEERELEHYDEHYTERIEISVNKTPEKHGLFNSADGITISMSGWNIWQLLDDEHKEAVLEDHAYWSIIERALRYEMGQGVASENFNSTLHKLRKMIFTDRDLVGDMLSSLVCALLDEIERSKEQRYEYQRAYYSAYHDNIIGERMREIRNGRRFPHVEDMEGERPRLDRKTLREKLMAFMDGLLLPASEEFEEGEDNG